MNLANRCSRTASPSPSDLMAFPFQAGWAVICCEVLHDKNATLAELFRVDIALNSSWEMLSVIERSEPSANANPTGFRCLLQKWLLSVLSSVPELSGFSVLNTLSCFPMHLRSTVENASRPRGRSK